MKLKPLFDRVLALPIKTQKQTASGITLSENDESEVKKAKVVAVGSGIYENGTYINMSIKVGDIIFYEEHTTAKLCDGSIEYILIKQTDVLAYEED